MKHQRIHIASVLVAALVVAACSSGESVITSGNDPEPTATEPAADDGDDADGPAADDGTDSDEPATDDSAPPDDGANSDEPDATTTSTTEPSPLAGLPTCATDALDTADGVVEITYWHGLNVENEDALVAVVDGYHESQDRVRINLQNQGSYLDTIDEYYQSSDDSRPNIVMFPEYAMQQAIDSDTVLPAGGCIESSGFDTTPLQPAVLEAYTAADVLWGMPFNVSVPVLYYRKDLFENDRMNLTEPPATFAQLRSYSESMVGMAAYGLAIDSDIDSWGGWFVEEWFAAADVPFSDNDNGRSGRSTEVYFDADFGVDLFTFLQDMIDDDIAFYVGDNASGADHLLKMADPERPAAMTLGTSAALGSVIAALGGGLVEGLGTDDVGVGPMPSPTGQTSVIVGGAANYIVAGKGDLETAAAWDFLTYLVEPEVQSAWTVATGYLPLRDDALGFEPALTTFAEDPRYRVAYDSLAASADTAGAGPLLGPHRQVRTELANAVAAIMTGADVRASLEAAATLAEAYLADYDANN
jgi:sn-glycerol 3-phosphate transport system substrate-binding protein